MLLILFAILFFGLMDKIAAPGVNIALFVMNALFWYSNHIIDVELATIKNVPGSALDWKILAVDVKKEVEQHVTKIGFN